MEDLIQAAVLHTPVANQLRVGGAQVDLLIGQFDESSKLVWTDAVGAEFIKGSVFLPGAGGEACVRLQIEGRGSLVHSLRVHLGYRSDPDPGPGTHGAGQDTDRCCQTPKERHISFYWTPTQVTRSLDHYDWT